MKKILMGVVAFSLFLYSCHSSDADTRNGSKDITAAGIYPADTAGLAAYWQMKGKKWQNSNSGNDSVSADTASYSEKEAAAAFPAAKNNLHPSVTKTHKHHRYAASRSAGSRYATGNSGTASVPASTKHKTSKAAKGALIGAGSGAVLGAIVGKGNRGLGAVVGAAVGGGVGYGIGKSKDKKDNKK